jgi:hypothetical protein
MRIDLYPSVKLNHYSTPIYIDSNLKDGMRGRKRTKTSTVLNLYIVSGVFSVNCLGSMARCR